MDITIARKVKTLLLDGDYAQLVDLCEEDRRYWKALRRSQYEIDEGLRQSAIEATALLIQRWWQEGREEDVREYMRRLMLSLTDESGEIGWSAPETIAAIIYLVPELLKPYGSMMIHRTLDEPPLVNGALWGIGHLGNRMKENVELFQDRILGVLETDDPQTLGLGARAMGEASFKPALPLLERLKN
jgi:Arc/MetJ family transcription regulator